MNKINDKNMLRGLINQHFKSYKMPYNIDDPEDLKSLTDGFNFEYQRNITPQEYYAGKVESDGSSNTLPSDGDIHINLNDEEDPFLKIIKYIEDTKISFDFRDRQYMLAYLNQRYENTDIQIHLIRRCLKNSELYSEQRMQEYLDVKMPVTNYKIYYMLKNKGINVNDFGISFDFRDPKDIKSGSEDLVINKTRTEKPKNQENQIIDVFPPIPNYVFDTIPELLNANSGVIEHPCPI